MSKVRIIKVTTENRLDKYQYFVQVKYLFFGWKLVDYYYDHADAIKSYLRHGGTLESINAEIVNES